MAGLTSAAMNGSGHIGPTADLVSTGFGSTALTSGALASVGLGAGGFRFEAGAGGLVDGAARNGSSGSVVGAGVKTILDPSAGGGEFTGFQSTGSAARRCAPS